MTYRRRLVFPALVAAGALWGTTVPLSKLALTWLAPGWLAFARFALAAALLAVVSRSKLRGALSPAILVTGAAGYGGSVLLQNLGIERTSVTHGALLIGATPVLVAVMAAALGHGVARPLAWAGFGLSLIGVGFVAGGRGGGASLGGDGLVFVSQLASAGFTVSQARLLRGRDPIAVTALQLMSAAVAMLPTALLTGHAPTAAGSPAAMTATAVLVLAGTVAPTTLFAFGQSRVSADVAGAFLNLEPLFGAAIGVVLFGNPMGAVQAGGGAAIVSGIGLSAYQVVRQERARRSGLMPAPAAAVAGGQDRPPAAAMAAAATSTPGPDPATPSALRLVPVSGQASRTRWPDRGAPAVTRRDGLRAPMWPASRPGRVTRRRASRPGQGGSWPDRGAVGGRRHGLARGAGGWPPDARGSRLGRAQPPRPSAAA